MQQPTDKPQKSGKKPATERKKAPSTPPRPASDGKTETGGGNGPDPTRYGDWERGGRCIDF